MLKLRERALELLNLYNYFDEAIIFDDNAIAVYYYNNRTDINPIGEEEIVGKHLMEIFPELQNENSTVMKALISGISTYNMQQKVKLYTGQYVTRMTTTIPISEEGKITGAVEVSRNMKFDYRRNIYITPDTGRRSRQLFSVDDIISCCSEMKCVKDKIKKVSETDSPVMIYGRTGTGKEMVAESIHTGGKRKNQAFISQNCAAIPETLLESILFGTVRGSFTGAEDRPGLFESADGGTLFLDEINNMPLSLQSKILKAIEEQKITRVGDYEPHSINVRIIAATNEEPIELVKSMKLREDLYYRLRVVQINLPTLNERKGDISLLTEYFIKKYNKIMHKNILGLDEDTTQMFSARDWKGNIRELENTIECAFNFSDEPYIHLSDIPWFEEEIEEELFPELDVDSGKTLKMMLNDYEHQLICEAVNRHDSIHEMADELGITRQNLYHKLKSCKVENKFYMDRKF